MLKPCWIHEALQDFVSDLLSTGLSSPAGSLSLLFCCQPFSFLIFQQGESYLSSPLDHFFLNSLKSEPSL